MQLTPIEKLDEVLKYLASPFGKAGIDFDTLNSKISEKQIIKDADELIEILDELFEDKTITKFDKTTNRLKELWSSQPSPITLTYYKITFTGRLLVQKHGYAQQEANLRNLERLKIVQSRMVHYSFWVNVIIACGTSIAGIYYLIEILKYYHSH